MNRLLRSVIAVAAILLVSASLAQAQSCVKIQAGTLLASDGITPLRTGYDQWGYNYQAHMFNGLAVNYGRPVPPLTEGTENLVMKWSDDWLANVDCNGDGKLDRGLDVKTGLSDDNSKGWVTNHYEGDYEGTDGELHHYTYFAKIVWVGPATSPDPWGGEVTAGNPTGRRIWGVYAIIEEIQTDPYGEYGGRLKADKLVPPGLGQIPVIQ